MNNSFCILVNTCDAYADVWPMFFHILKEVWKQKLPTIYVNTESKSIDVEGIKICWLHADKINIPWGERLLQALYRIPEKRILMMLEDFYYENPIRIDGIDFALKRMCQDKSLFAVQLVPAGECHTIHINSCPTESIGMNFYERKQFGMYKIIAGPTIWEKKDLIRLTKKNDSPWEWEFFGSFRTWLYGKKELCWINTDDPIFDYDVAHGGAVHRGKWVGYKTKELEQKYKYSIDYSHREIEDDWIVNNQSQKKSLKKRMIDAFNNRIKKYLNIAYGCYLRILK